MRKRWYYLYAIFYPAKNYQCYYGSRISDKSPQEDTEYFGSSVTFAHYNDLTHSEYQPDALKVIIWARKLPDSVESARRLADLEADMIKQALAESGPKLCLNRNYSGRFVLTREQRRLAVREGGRVVSERYAKCFAFMSPSGDVVRLRNLKAFCRQNGLEPANMRRVNSGERQTHKGWRRYNPFDADLAE